MLLTEIDHVAIAVHDLEAAIEYYRSAFGAEVHHQRRIGRRGDPARAEEHDRELSLARNLADEFVGGAEVARSKLV